MTEKAKQSKTFQYLLVTSVAIFMIITFYSFVKAAFTGDIEVFIAAENQVKYKEAGGIKALFEAWELKGIANRSLMYILYKIGTIIAPYGKVTILEPVIKCIYAVIMMAFISGATVLISPERETRLFVFFVEYLMVFCTYTAAQLQAEMTVVVLSIFVFSLLVHDGKKCIILAGVLGGTLFFFKSIFVLLFIPTLAGASLYSNCMKENRFLQCFGVYAISETIMIGFVKIYYPQEFVDMSAAKDFQATVFTECSNVGLWDMLNKFFSGFTTASIAFPFILIGLISVVMLTIFLIRERDWRTLIGIIIVWLPVIDIIIASNRYFLYHYYLLSLPSIISVLLLWKKWTFDKELLLPAGMCSILCVVICWELKNGVRQTPLINNSTVLLVIIHLLVIAISVAILNNNSKIKNVGVMLTLTICSFFYLNYSSFVAPKWRNEQMLLKQSEAACAGLFPDDFGNEPVLFLDEGAVTFYVDAPSYSKYFYNLPMQRWQSGNDWALQKSEYEALMNYYGKYIVYTNWFGLEKYPELQRKIENEYKRIPQSSIYTFSPNWNFFNLSNPTNIMTLRNADDRYILIRK